MYTHVCIHVRYMYLARAKARAGPGLGRGCPPPLCIHRAGAGPELMDLTMGPFFRPLAIQKLSAGLSNSCSQPMRKHLCHSKAALRMASSQVAGNPHNTENISQVRFIVMYICVYIYIYIYMY